MRRSETSYFQIDWGIAVSQHGVTSVPNILIRYQKALGLTMAEFIFLCNLISYADIPFRFQGIKIPSVSQRQVEYLTEDELEALLGAINLTEPSGMRTRALLEVLYATGMRIGEVISMDQDDIDWKNYEAIITNVKSKEQEKVYFSERSLSWLKQYLLSRNDHDPALFISGGTRLVRASSQGCFVRHLRTLAVSLGIKKKITHHLFRKTFVTHLLQRKADIMAVKDLARHKSERTTLTNYAGVDKERSKAIHGDIMEGLLG